MAVPALLVLTALTVRYGSAVESTTADCSILVTGPKQPWTPSKSLAKLPPVAASGKHQFAGRPPGRREVVFSVRSTSSGLRVRLFSELQPGGYLLHVGRNGWLVERTLPGTDSVVLSSGEPPPDQVTSAGDWASYSVSVSSYNQLRLQRLYDNGTRVVWLEVQDSFGFSVDTVTVRSVAFDVKHAGEGMQATVTDGWSLWTFDSLYQKAGLCDIVPVEVRAPLSSSVTSISGVSLEVGSGAGTAQLLLFGTSERYYIVTLTPSELTLGRAELGVPLPRQVARVCRTPPPGAARSPDPVRLSLHSFTGAEGDKPARGTECCAENDHQGPTMAEPAIEGSAVEEAAMEGSAMEEAAMEGSAAEESAMEESAMGGSAALDDLLTLQWSGEDPETADMTEISDMAVMVEAAEPVTLEGSAEKADATDETAMTAVTRADDVVLPLMSGRTILSWQDGHVRYMVTIGAESADGQTVWKAYCPPTSESTGADGNLARSSGIGIFRTTGADKRFGSSDSGHSGADEWSEHSLLVTVVLSVVSLVLLVISLVLASLLVTRRRRQRASFSPEKTDLFDAPPGGLECDDVRHYDDVRQQCVKPGVSSFRPVRRQATAVSVTTPEVPLEELSLPPPPPGMQETSLDRLPPPPGQLEPSPEDTRQSTPPLPPLPAEQRASLLPPSPEQLLPLLVTHDVVLDQLQPLPDPLPPPPPSPPGQVASQEQFPPPPDQTPPTVCQRASQLPLPPDDI